MSDMMEEYRVEIETEQNIVTKLGCIKNLMVSLGLTIEQAMSALKISDEERKVILNRI